MMNDAIAQLIVKEPFTIVLALASSVISIVVLLNALLRYRKQISEEVDLKTEKQLEISINGKNVMIKGSIKGSDLTRIVEAIVREASVNNELSVGKRQHEKIIGDEQ